MEISSDLTEAQRAEMFREFHAEHLRRQTEAMEGARRNTGWILGIIITQIVLGLIFLAMVQSGVNF